MGTTLLNPTVCYSDSVYFPTVVLLARVYLFTHYVAFAYVVLLSRIERMASPSTVLRVPILHRTSSYFVRLYVCLYVLHVQAIHLYWATYGIHPQVVR